MKAIILAAGVGKRLWPVTQHKPKCLIEIGGQTLLSRYLESLAAVRIRQATIVVGYKQDMIRAAVGSQCQGSTSLSRERGVSSWQHFLIMDRETGADRRCGHHGCGCVVSPGNRFAVWWPRPMRIAC